MLVRLTLENFMAHGRTVLDLGPGLTVLVGPNNTGKSAVVEALRCLAENPPAQAFVRHGAREARVTAELADGHRVVWIRKPRSAGYQLFRPGADAPDEFWKLRQGQVPDEVAQVLRLGRVALETGDAVDVHLGDQRKPVFLLDDQRLLAPFFAAQAESGHLLAMQKRLKERMAEARAADNRARNRQAELAEALGRLAPLPELQLAGQGLAERHRELLAASEELPRLEAFRNTLLQAGAEADRLAARGRTVRELREPPGLSPVLELERLLREGDVLAGRRRQRLARHAVLGGLQTASGLFPAAALAKDLARFADLARRQSADRTRLAALAGLAAPPAPADARLLGRLTADLHRLAAQGRRLAARGGALGALQPPPQPDETKDLARLLDDLNALLARRRAAEAKVQATAEAAQRAGERLRQRFAQAGACPLCGTAMEVGHDH